MSNPVDVRAAAIMEAVRLDHPDMPVYDQYDRALTVTASALASTQWKLAQLRRAGEPWANVLAKEERILLEVYERLQMLRALYLSNLRVELGNDPYFWQLLRTPVVAIPPWRQRRKQT